MKNILLFVFLGFSIASQAQFEKGQRVIGGQLSLQLVNSKPFTLYQRNTYISPSFSFSKFKTPTVLNGFGFNYAYNYWHNYAGTSNEQTSYDHSIGMFVSSTKLKQIAKRLHLGFTGTGGVNYGFGKTKIVLTAENTDRKSYNVNVLGGMGLFYQLTPRFLLDAGIANLLTLSFTHNTESSYSGVVATKTSTNSFALSTGLSGLSLSSISIGVRYMLK